ncbi:MAG: VOC family protein [Gemmatimonadota bacterium]
MNTSEGELSLSEIGQVSINVHDLDRATDFYREVLGMHHLFSAPPKMAFFACGGVRLMLAVPEREEFDHPASILYYRVHDMEAAYRTLAARGVRFEGEPHAVHRTDTHELWMASFRDSEGNLLALMSEVEVT